MIVRYSCCDAPMYGPHNFGCPDAVIVDELDMEDWRERQAQIAADYISDREAA